MPWWQRLPALPAFTCPTRPPCMRGHAPVAATGGAPCAHPSHPLLPPQEFVGGIDGIPEGAKAELLALTPATYIGNAAQQAKDIRRQLAAL